MKFMFRAVACAALLTGIILTACTNDDAEPGNPDEGGSLSGISDDFKWRNTSAKQLTVGVVDEYAGRFNYTIEVYDADPVLNPEANLLAGGKINGQEVFRAQISVPNAQETLYILQTDPLRRKSLFTCEVTEGDLICNLGESAAVPVKSISTKADDDRDRVDFSYDRNSAIEITGSGNVAVESRKTYVIRGEFTGNLTNLTGANQVSVYVEGKWKITQPSLIFQNSFSLFVLNDGEISTAADCRIQCSNASLIAVQAGGEIDGDIDISMNNGGVRIVNEGEMEIRSLYMESSARVTNYCVIEVDGKINAPSGGAMIELKPGTLVECGSLTGGNLHIDMGVASVFKVKKDDDHSDATGVANFNSWNNQVTGPNIKNGTSKDFALFVADQVTSGVTFSENVEWYAKKYDYGVTTRKPARMAIDKPNVDIDDDACNRYSGNHNPGEGSGDTDDEYQPEGGATYTYLFEDNWPYLGDYDMNDLVMDITIANKTVKNNAVAVTLTTRVRAVGATKSLYAFARIEAPGAGNLEVPLFDGEVHALLGTTTDQMINTMPNSVTCEPVEVVKTYSLPANVQGIVNAENLNVFVVWGEPDGKRRNEIHLPEYAGTDKAATAVTSRKYKYKFNPQDETSDPKYENMMWGLMIPTNDFQSYPRESTSIMDVYGQFETWAKSGGSQYADWYKYPTDKGKLYPVAGVK